MPEHLTRTIALSTSPLPPFSCSFALLDQYIIYQYQKDIFQKLMTLRYCLELNQLYISSLPLPILSSPRGCDTKAYPHLVKKTSLVCVYPRDDKGIPSMLDYWGFPLADDALVLKNMTSCRRVPTPSSLV